MLALPDFSESFTIECDAADLGTGTVLQQEGQPIASSFHNWLLNILGYPAYEKELISLVKAICYWQPYLWGQQFDSKTDNYSFKFLLEQKVLNSTQEYWISKLLGFDPVVEYRAGKENVVVDALSYQFEFASECHAIQFLLLIILMEFG